MENIDYQKQAIDFLQKTGTTMKIEFLKNDFHFVDDKEKRDIYKVTISRKNKKFSTNFGNSLFDSELHKSPSEYDVLACLQKYDCGTFEDFCFGFGYSKDSRSAKKIYIAVCKEFENVQKIWSDEEIKLLQEIN